jgi:hypothetical protein
VRLENNNNFFYVLFKNALAYILQRWRCSRKFRSRGGIGYWCSKKIAFFIWLFRLFCIFRRSLTGPSGKRKGRAKRPPRLLPNQLRSVKRFMIRQQSTVFNNMVLPPGVKFAPRGELCPLGGMFTPSFAPRGEHTPLFRRMGGGKQRISPPVYNFTPRGQNSLIGDNFDPGGQSLPLWVKLRMGLRLLSDCSLFDYCLFDLVGQHHFGLNIMHLVPYYIGMCCAVGYVWLFC